jgi:DNA-binding IscR family transcriptional regulator
MSIECSLRFVWEEIRDVTIGLLGTTTFADLAQRAGGQWRVSVDADRSRSAEKPAPTR